MKGLWIPLLWIFWFWRTTEFLADKFGHWYCLKSFGPNCELPCKLNKCKCFNHIVSISYRCLNKYGLKLELILNSWQRFLNWCLDKTQISDTSCSLAMASPSLREAGFWPLDSYFDLKSLLFPHSMMGIRDSATSCCQIIQKTFFKTPRLQTTVCPKCSPLTCVILWVSGGGIS